MSGSVYFIFLIGGLALCVIGGMFAHRPKRVPALRHPDPDVGAPLPALPVRDRVSR
jgi:hypothetical protein